MAKKRYTAQQMIDAIGQARGYVTKAAALLGCDARTVYRYAEESPTVQQAIDEQREQRTDFVESALLKAIEEGNVTAMIFYLKADPHSKARGWSERSQHEHTGADGGPLDVKFAPAVDYRSGLQVSVDNVSTDPAS